MGPESATSSSTLLSGDNEGDRHFFRGEAGHSGSLWICQGERGREEIDPRQELIGLLDREAHPKAYIGYEPSGFVHVGNGIPVAHKIKDLVAAGVEFTFFLADWHAMINNKLGGDLDAIRTCGRYFEDAFRALTVPEGVRFLLASDLVTRPSYWRDVIHGSESARGAPTKRAPRSG